MTTSGIRLFKLGSPNTCHFRDLSFTMHMHDVEHKSGTETAVGYVEHEDYKKVPLADGLGGKAHIFQGTNASDPKVERKLLIRFHQRTAPAK